MNAKFFAAAVLLDSAAGDPHWFPHPVRIIGAAIANGEKLVRKRVKNPAGEFAGGALLAGAIIFAAYQSLKLSLAASRKINPNFGALVEIGLAWTTLAARSLHDETGKVLNALNAGDIRLARLNLSMIVGRDTANLDESEISRAVIETAAESLCDGIVAPLFYLAIGGVPLAFAYKAANTLDSMIGHTEFPYFYFGKFAARFDDSLNFVPARLTAVLIIAAAKLCRADATAGFTIWRRDANLHKSPNAGQSEAAMAGALNVRLGGVNYYDGAARESAFFAEEFEPPTVADASRARQIVLTAAILASVSAVAACWLINRRANRALKI